MRMLELYDTFLDLYDSLREVFSDDPGELTRSEQISAVAQRGNPPQRPTARAHNGTGA